MYPVSDEYKQAIAQRNREFKLNAQIYLRDKTILSIGDDELKNTTGDRYVKGDVKIESQMMSGSVSDNMIDIGAVPSAKLTMTVFSASTDMHIFSGAYLWLYVSLKLPGGAWEPVPMGKFYINGASISREGNWVSFEAYDGMIKLQYELTDEMRRQLKGKTAMDAAKILCGDQLPLGSAISPAGGYVECPNYELPLNFDSPQIETARDGIMWIAQIMGCFAHVNRLGVLEFVPIKSWWKMYDDTTGTILAVRNIGGGSRFKTRFSDDRIHIVGVTMRGGDGKLVTKRYSYSHESGEDPTSDVTVELETNPLIIGSETPLETILENILSELSTAYFYAFQTEITNDPALDAGDTIRLLGGVINGTNANNDLIGFITHSTWVYRKRQTITNASSVPIVYEDAASEIALMSDDSGIAAQADSEPLNFLPPRSQSDKAQLGIGGEVCTILASNMKKPRWELKNDNATLQMYDPGGGKQGHITMRNTEIRLETENGCQLLLYKDACYIWFGGALYNFYPDGRINITANNANFFQINVPERLINLNGKVLQAVIDRGERNGLYYNGKRVLTE